MSPDRFAGIPTSAEQERLWSAPFALVLGMQFCFGLAFSSFFLLPKYLATELGADADAIGSVSATGLLSAVALIPLSARLLDRERRAKIVLVGAVLHALAALGFCEVHALGPALYALRGVLGLAYLLVFNATSTLAADLAPAARLGQALGLSSAAALVTNAIAPAGGELVAEHLGYGPVFVFAAVMSGVVALLSLGVKEPQADATSRAVRRRALDSAGSDAARRALPPAGVLYASAVSGAAFGALFTFTEPFALSLGARRVSGFFVGYTLAALAARLLLGKLADRTGRQRVAFGALVMYGLVTAGTGLLTPERLVPLGAGFGLAQGLLYPALNALAVEHVPRERRGSRTSYFSGAFSAGFALWVLPGGFLARHAGYPMLFLSSGLLALTALWFVPSKRPALP